MISTTNSMEAAISEKSHSSAVVLCPPSSAWAPIQAIREQHDRHFRRWMPHVTLLYPFAPADRYGDWLINRLARAAAGCDPFELTLSTFRHFDHGGRSHTIWLDPDPASSVTDVQNKLWEAFPVFDDVRSYPSGFTPHLSVGQARSREQCDVLLESLQDAWEPITFRADRVSLIWRNDAPDDVFRVYRSFVLGTGEVIEP